MKQNKRNQVILPIVIIAVIAISGYLLKSTFSPVPIPPITQWKSYENTANHYVIKYPPNGRVQQVQEEERGFLENSRQITVYYPPNSLVGITTWDPSIFKATSDDDNEVIRMISLDLRSFAELARQKEINNESTNFSNKKVGGLKEILFANQKAFLYVVTGSKDGYGHSDDDYLFFEHNHIKYAVYSAHGDKLSQMMLNSFAFTEDKKVENAGKISSTTDGVTKFVNNKYGFVITYPKGWYEGDSHPEDGYFQITNYDMAEANGSDIFPKGMNKIEASISSVGIYGTSPEYPEVNRVTKSVTINGQPATRTEAEYKSGSKILYYAILIPIIPDAYYGLAMYGDSSNFYILDDLVKSLEWLKK